MKAMTNYKQSIHKSCGSPFPFFLLKTHREDLKCRMRCRKKKNESVIDEGNKIKSEQNRELILLPRGFPFPE